ncbi:MAG: pyridoxamine 5'-phosphate oxidase family protein [Anaerolineae bacterium]|nr:pyridoxamine 5'-phosphate oxidase family protein [Anaerolineae bacterium]
MLSKVVALAEEVGHVLVATADAAGLPHVASAGRLTLAPDGRVLLAEWFCPGTMSNLQQNRRIALVVWNADTDTGYQLLGKVEQVRDLAILDGYAPEQEDESPPPQVERELLVRVDKILDFSHAPHSDVVE